MNVWSFIRNICIKYGNIYTMKIENKKEIVHIDEPCHIPSSAHM